MVPGWRRISGPAGVTEALAEPAGLEQVGQSQWGQKVLGAESLTLRLQTCLVSQCPPGRLQPASRSPAFSVLSGCAGLQSAEWPGGPSAGGRGLSPCISHCRPTKCSHFTVSPARMRMLNYLSEEGQSRLGIISFDVSKGLHSAAAPHPTQTLGNDVTTLV